MNHDYPKIEGELPKSASYFVSFWWALLWKEAIAVVTAVGLWQVTAGWFDNGWWLVLLGVFFAVGFYLFLRELFYATLEKRYLRKNFTMLGVDKDGDFTIQKLDQARALLWSFVWGHFSLMLTAISICAVLALFVWLSEGVPFWSLWAAMVASLTSNSALVAWALVFSIYPHYRLWSRPFFNLAGFRLALVAR